MRSGVAGQHDLPVVLDHSLVQWSPRPPPDCRNPAPRKRIAGSPKPGIDAVADGAACVGQRPGQVESVTDVQRSADLVSELGQQQVVPPTGNPVKFSANVEQGELGVGQRTQRVLRSANVAVARWAIASASSN